MKKILEPNTIYKKWPLKNGGKFAVAEILKGKPVADAITEDIKNRSDNLKSKGTTPTLAIVRVGENPADMAYERGALKRAEKAGVLVRQIILEESVDTENVVANIKKLNEDENVHGVLIFSPLPKHIDEDKVRNTLAAEKDVDGIGDRAMAGVYSGKDIGYSPCTAQACVEILKHYNIPIKGQKVTVIGRSLIIGRPVAMMLMKEHGTVTICHTRTLNIEEEAKAADILIAAAGKAKIVDQSYMTEKQVIIDVGINVDEEGNMCGDVNFENGEKIVKAITPVPGGVGSVTTSILMKHVVEAAEKNM